MYPVHFRLPSLRLIAIFGALGVLTLVPAIELIESGEARPPLLAIFFAVNALAIIGVYLLVTTGSSIAAWAGFGANLGWGMIAIFSIGMASLFVALTLLIAIVVAAKRRHLPVITWPGLLAESICFFICGGFFVFGVF